MLSRQESTNGFSEFPSKSSRARPMIPDEDDDEWSLWLGLSGMLVIQGKVTTTQINLKCMIVS